MISLIHTIWICNNTSTWNWIYTWRGKIGFNLMDDDDFTIPYIIKTIPKSPAGIQLLTQNQENCLDYLSQFRTAHNQKRRTLWTAMLSDRTWKLKIKNKIVQEEKIPIHISWRNFVHIWSNHTDSLTFGIFLPDKPKASKDIGESLKGHQCQLWKFSLFFQYDNNKNVNLLSALIPTK